MEVVLIEVVTFVVVAGVSDVVLLLVVVVVVVCKGQFKGCGNELKRCPKWPSGLE